MAILGRGPIGVVAAVGAVGEGEEAGVVAPLFLVAEVVSAVAEQVEAGNG